MNLELEPVYDGTDNVPYPYQTEGMFTRTSARIWGTNSDGPDDLIIRDCNPNGDLELLIGSGVDTHTTKKFVIPFNERKNFLRIIADVNPPADPVSLPDEFGEVIYYVITEEYSFDKCVRVGDNFISDDGYTVEPEDILEFVDKNDDTFVRSADKFYAIPDQ